MTHLCCHGLNCLSQLPYWILLLPYCYVQIPYWIAWLPYCYVQILCFPYYSLILKCLSLSCCLLKMVPINVCHVVQNFFGLRPQLNCRLFALILQLLDHLGKFVRTYPRSLFWQTCSLHWWQDLTSLNFCLFNIVRFHCWWIPVAVLQFFGYLIP